MIYKALALTLALVSTLPLLNGCAAVAVGGAAAAGAVVANDRRASGIILQDQQIELDAMKLLRDHPDIKSRSNISVTSYNLRVLLTGETESAELARRYASLVSQLPHVRSVYNEVTETARAGLWDDSEDTYLTSKAKLAIFNVDIDGFNPNMVKVLTSKGEVFLMGLVTPAEGRATVEEVRGLNGVKRVVEVFEYIEQ